MVVLYPGLRRSLRYFITGGLAFTVLLTALGIAAVAFARQVASRIEINFDPDAIGKALHEAVVVTLREGTPQQKLDIIASFDSVTPADAPPYIPLLEQAAKDPDLAVSQAATKAIERINAGKPSMPRE